MDEGTLVGLRNSRTFIVKVSGKKEWVPGLGVIDTKRLLGHNFGEKITIFDQDFLIVKPVLEDIISNMEKITQTVSLKDMGMMILRSGIRQGSNVAEVGVGSGFLSVGILYYIIPGVLYGYDISSRNLDHVKNVLDWLGWKEHFIPVRIEDKMEFIEGNMDAIFLDIPDPSTILENSYASLRENGRIIAYLPNITQVHNFFNNSRSIGIKRIRIYEVIEREWIAGDIELRPENTGLLHTAFLVIGEK